MMAPFEHVVSLVSFVYAFALTYLLARLVALYDMRQRVIFSGLQALMVVNAVLLVFGNWLALWPLRLVKNWDFLSIADNFALGILIFFTCAIAAPEKSEGPVDLDAYYWQARRPFYWLFAAGNAVAMLGNLDFLKSSDPSLFWTWTGAASLGFPPIALALAFPARWAQWTGGALLAALFIVGNFMLGNLT